MEAHFDTLGTARAHDDAPDRGDPGQRRPRRRRRATRAGGRTAHALGPLLAAVFANSPFVAIAARPAGARRGSRSGSRSSAAGPRRSAPRATAGSAWAEYALRAPVMFIRATDARLRPGLRAAHLRATGSPTATSSGGRPRTTSSYHLTTLFPPIRPRGWLELRMIDTLPARLGDRARRSSRSRSSRTPRPRAGSPRRWPTRGPVEDAARDGAAPAGLRARRARVLRGRARRAPPARRADATSSISSSATATATCGASAVRPTTSSTPGSATGRLLPDPEGQLAIRGPGAVRRSTRRNPTGRLSAHDDLGGARPRRVARSLVLRPGPRGAARRGRRRGRGRPPRPRGRPRSARRPARRRGTRARGARRPRRRLRAARPLVRRRGDHRGRRPSGGAAPRLPVRVRCSTPSESCMSAAIREAEALDLALGRGSEPRRRDRGPGRRHVDRRPATSRPSASSTTATRRPPRRRSTASARNRW